MTRKHQIRQDLSSETNMKVFTHCSILIALFIPHNDVLAHGTVTSPASRVWQCRQENPEQPKSEACKAAISLSGSQGIYDWNGIRVGNAAGNHRQHIANGELCSAGMDSHAGLDLIRDDWVATMVSPGPFQFTWTNSAPHATKYYHYYITNKNYTTDQALTWEGIEPICQYGASPAAASSSHHCQLPQREGKHVVYAIWQRSDSPEAFYACIDLDFGGADIN